MAKSLEADQHDPYEALRFKEFRIFLFVRFVITIAVQIETIVVGWFLYAITKDPLSLGLIGLAEAFPAIGVALYAGHVADLLERKKIVTIAYGALIFTSLVLFFFTLNYQEFLPITGTLPIYAAIFISGLARGFMNPANFALMGQVVPKKAYLNSSTWNSGVWQVGSIVGPTLGGFLYAFIGATYSFGIVAALILSGLIAILFITPRPVNKDIEIEPIGERLVSGLRFVFQNKTILSAISLDLFAVLFGGAVALLPAFADDILHVGTIGLGFLRAAPAIGSSAMALFLAFRAPMKNPGTKMLYAVAGFGMCMIGFAFSTSFILSFLFLLFSGAFDNISVVIRATILQILTPDGMRGRVAAVNSMFIGSSNEIGAFESGVAGKYMGLVPSVIFGGVMTLIVVTVTWLKAPSLKKISLSRT